MTAPLRVVVVANIPTPYRDPWYDAFSARDDIELTVVYLGSTHPVRRHWTRPPASYRGLVLSDQVVELGEVALHPSVRAGRVLAPLRPDIVLIGGWDEPFFWTARRWARRAGVPIVVVIESHATSGARRGGFTAGLRTRFLSGAAGVIAMSQAAEAFVAELGFPGPVLLDPHTVAPPLRPAPPAPREPGRRLLFLGAVHPRKNPQKVLDVATALAAPGLPVTVDVVGDGDLPLVMPPVDSGVEVVRWGQLLGGDLEQRWHEASCLVAPSLADAGPMVLAEAAARGVPFVASDRCGAAPTLVGLGAIGLGVALEAGVADWAAAVEQVCARPRHVVPEVLPEASVVRVSRFLHDPTVGAESEPTR